MNIQIKYLHYSVESLPVQSMISLIVLTCLSAYADIGNGSMLINLRQQLTYDKLLTSWFLTYRQIIVVRVFI